MSNKEIDQDILDRIGNKPDYRTRIWAYSPYSLEEFNKSMKRLIRRKLIKLGENNKWERIYP